MFEAAAGPDVAGARHVGPAAVRRAYAAVFATYADARWNQPRHFVAGDRAVSEWTFTGTTKDGTRVEVNGCDLFTLRRRPDRAQELLPQAAQRRTAGGLVPSRSSRAIDGGPVAAPGGLS